MFAYCNNNPASSSDPTGTCPSCAAARNSDQIMTDVLCRFGGGSSLTLAVSAVATASAVQVVAETQTLALKQEPQGSYTVYFLYEKDDVTRTIIYVGRVKTANFEARMAYHKSRGRLLDRKIDNLSYEVCRALEQVGMIYYHTVNRDRAINNQIRGISPYNKNKYTYMAALWDIVNRSMYDGENCIPYSYLANLTEEMFLNGTP